MKHVNTFGALVFALGIAVVAKSAAAQTDPLDAVFAPYVDKTCTGAVLVGRNWEVISRDKDGKITIHHFFAVGSTSEDPDSRATDGGWHPIAKSGWPGWVGEFTSNTGAQHSLNPTPEGLHVRVKTSGVTVEADYKCHPTKKS